MRICRIDQNSATLIDTFQRFRHVHPIDGKDNDIALGSHLILSFKIIGKQGIV